MKNKNFNIIRFLSFIAILFCLLSASAQNKINCSYTDSIGNIHYGFIEKHNIVDIQNKVIIYTNSSPQAYMPSQLKGFSYFGKKDTLRYETIDFNDQKYFLSRIRDGQFFREYYFYYNNPRARGHPVTIKTIFAKDGVSIAYEPTKENISHVFADYPLLSSMIKNNLVDVVNGYESNLIFDEYNSWRMDNSEEKYGDTSIVLKAMFDANTNYNPHKYFVINQIIFWIIGLPTGGFASSIPVAIMAGTAPKNKNLNIKNESLILNSVYLNAYRLRAHTKKAEACLKGAFLN
jgi:hypothetical protein